MHALLLLAAVFWHDKRKGKRRKTRRMSCGRAFLDPIRLVRMVKEMVS
jgi:hypothetical protein